MRLHTPPEVYVLKRCSKLRVFENRALRTVVECKREEATRG
jgi:hypothetical protein